MSDAIVFSASVNQVRTLADGGIRVTLDLPEDAIPQMAMLAECKRQGIYLQFEVTASTELYGEAESKPEGKTVRVGRSRLSK